jgi:hypothetical protein
VIAHHARQECGKPIERARSDATNEPKSHQGAKTGKSVLDGAFEEIRFVVLARHDTRSRVKNGVGWTLYRAPDVAKINRL